MKKNYFLLILSFSFLLIFLLPGCKKDSDQEEPITAEDGHHVCKYVNGDYVGHIHHFEDTPFDVSCTADGKKIWVVTDGKELKQGDENGNFSTIDTFGDSPLSVTISSDGSLGYVCTDKGGLCKYVNGEYVGHIHTFDDEPLGVSCTADGKKVWVVTDGRELKQGDENGNFSTIDTFGYTPYKVTLSADGSLGYVITSNKDVCKYVNGEYVGHIYHFDKGGPSDISCTADGKTLWVVTTDYILFKGNENGNFSQIDSFDDVPISVTLSEDGSLAYVLTDK